MNFSSNSSHSGLSSDFLSTHMCESPSTSTSPWRLDKHKPPFSLCYSVHLTSHLNIENHPSFPFCLAYDVDHESVYTRGFTSFLFWWIKFLFYYFAFPIYLSWWHQPTDFESNMGSSTSLPLEWSLPGGPRVLIINRSMVDLSWKFWKFPVLSLGKEDGSSPSSIKDEFAMKLNLLEFPILWAFWLKRYFLYAFLGRLLAVIDFYLF